MQILIVYPFLSTIQTATPPTPPSPSSKRKAPRTPTPTPASAPTATPPAPASAAPTARTQAPASATPSASPSESNHVPEAPTEVPDPEDFDRVWEQARAHAISKSSTSSDETSPVSSASTSATAMASDETPQASNDSPEMQPPTTAKVTKTHWNWYRVFDLSVYWMILSLVGSNSASFLAILVHVLGTMLLYKIGMLQRLVGARLPLPFIFFICICSLSSFTQGLDIEEDDDDDNDDEGFYGLQFGEEHEWSCGQRYVFKVAINFCRQIAKELYNTNQLFVPGGHWWTITGAFTMNNLAQLGDTSRSVVYYYGTKVGHALKGKVRKQLGYPNVRDKIFVIFNLDRQRGDNHTKLVNSVIKFCKEFCKGITPSNLSTMTIEQAISMEAAGLPFFASLFFYSIAYTAEECKFIGGGRAIMGYLRRMLLFVVESGVQALFPLLGIPLAKSTMPHEFITGYGLLNWVKKSHETCVECGRAFFKELDEMFGDLSSSTDDRVENFNGSFIEYVLKKCIRMTALSSWKPAIKCVPLTGVILDLIFNIGMWKNAFGDRKTNPKYPYDPSKGYNDDDRDFAFGNFEDFLEGIESTFASFAALDTNNEMLKAPLARARSLVTILDERGWKFFFSFRPFGLNIDVYYFQEFVGWWPSFIFIHGPPCQAFNTESPTLSSAEVMSMRQRAVELHLLFLFSRRFLSRTMTNGFNVSIDLSKYFVLGSILMAHAMFQYLVANFHLSTKGACLFAKNMIVSFNAFLEKSGGYVNGLYNENCNRKLVSYAVRTEIRRRNMGIRGFTKDMDYRQTVLNILSRCFSKKWSVAGLKALTVEAGLSLAVDVLKKDPRWPRFKEKKLIGGALLARLTNAYNRARGGSSGATEDKKEATQAIMKDVVGWPEIFPKGIGWHTTHEIWYLQKVIFGRCRIDVTFPDTPQGLLEALNALNRFIAMKKLKKNVFAAATSEQLEEMKKVMLKHIRVKDGNICDCEWCEEDSASDASTSTKKRAATTTKATKKPVSSTSTKKRAATTTKATKKPVYEANPAATAALKAALDSAQEGNGVVDPACLKTALGFGYSKVFIDAKVDEQEALNVKPAAKKMKTN